MLEPQEWIGLSKLVGLVFSLPLALMLIFAGIGLYALLEGPANKAPLRCLQRQREEKATIKQ